MKTTLTTLILILAGVTFAQNEVAYTYDNAGNRIKRENNTTFFIPPSTPQESSALSELNNSGIGLEAYPNPTAGNTVVTIIIDPETISEEHKIALA
ncbi:MAG: hypothetical protein JJT77_03300 [Crocinitomicaceae bacterium]|nr:hypothetical protein [Crocinitomicaceae bacterium]